MHTALGNLILIGCALLLLMLGLAAGLAAMARKPTIRFGEPPSMPPIYEGDMLETLKKALPKHYSISLN